MVALFYKECEACGALEERIFKDSWTGIELCAYCLDQVIEHVTNSPYSEEDNLKQLLVLQDLMEEISE